MDTRTDAPLSAYAGDRLRALRAERGISQQTLATASGVAKHAIATIESYERRIGLDELPRLCTALDCSLADLLDGGPDAAALRLGQRSRDWQRLAEAVRGGTLDGVHVADDGTTVLTQVKTVTDPLAARVAALEARLTLLEAR